MTKTATCLLVASLLALALPLAPAQAQSSRTYVSTSGNDANDCSRPTPCRTFQAAHDKTNPDGEVMVLDPGGYGGLTITKSISIVNGGVGEASILVSGGANGITVNAGAASYVNLRGITIQGIGFGGGTGLRFNSGFSLAISNCVIRNHTNRGIDFQPNGDSNLSISNTLTADNGTYGIVLVPTGSGSVKAAFNRVEVYNNSFDGIVVSGMLSTGTINVTVADSVVTSNAGSGFRVLTLGGKAATHLMVVRSVSANNQMKGIISDGPGAIVRVSRSTITGNGTGVASLASGQLWSFGDNNIIDNGTDGNPATTPLK